MNIIFAYVVSNISSAHELYKITFFVRIK